MNATEARMKTVESSGHYKQIISDIENKIKNGEFYLEYNFPIPETKLALAIAKVLSDKDFTVNYNEYVYSLHISWE